MNKIKTLYFTSMITAIRYQWILLGRTNLRKAKKIAEEKVEKGEFHIGKPPIKAGEKLTEDEDGMYIIESDDPGVGRTYVEELESALIDLLDGQSEAHEIRYKTGLSEERVIEIENLFNKVLETYKKRHGITQ